VHLHQPKIALTMDSLRNSARRHLLLIAYAFPPLVSPQSLRWYYLAKHLALKGYAVDVLTIRMPKSFYDSAYPLPDNVRIWRTFSGFFHGLTYMHSREKAVEKADHAASNAVSRAWQIAQLVHANAYKILNAFLVPDLYAEWFPFATHMCLHLLRKHRYQSIISSSEPRINHLVSYVAARRSGSFWIADYGDPWVYPIPIHYEPTWKRRALSMIEQSILPRMGAITLTSKGAKDLYLSHYPSLSENDVHVIPQGCEPDDFNQIRATGAPIFRIVYCGSFYRKIRDPGHFLQAVEEIDVKNLEVIVAGRNNDFAQILHSKSNVRYLGFVSHHEVLALEKGASVLLHLGNSMEVQVPGKLYEYIGARRPILAIQNSQNDPLAGLIRKKNRGLVVENNKQKIKASILKLYSMWQQGTLETSFDLGQDHEFTWAKRADQFIEILEKF